MLPPQRSAQSQRSSVIEDPTEDRRALTQKARLVAGMSAAAGSAVSLASVESGSTRRTAMGEYEAAMTARTRQGSANGSTLLRSKAASSTPASFTDVIVDRLSAALSAYEQGGLLTLYEPDGEETQMPPIEVTVKENGTVRRSPLSPQAFIISWLDASDRYGLGYALSNGCIGVHFRDSSSCVLSPSTESFDYVYTKRSSSADLQQIMQQPHHVLQRKYYPMPPRSLIDNEEAGGGAAFRAVASKTMPKEVVSKVEILNYFHAEITERLCGGDHPFLRKDVALTKDMPFVYKWFRSHNAIIFQMSDDTLQVSRGVTLSLPYAPC